MYLTAGVDVMAPVVGGTLVTALPHGVGWADALPCVGITVISHMGTLACW